MKPIVKKETDYPCRSLFHYDKKELLFRVLYYRKRIHLEVFHALSDGTGASWFLQLLISNYILLRYPESRLQRIKLPEDFQAPHHELGSQLDDSFARYFHKKKIKSRLNIKQLRIRISLKRKMEKSTSHIWTSNTG